MLLVISQLSCLSTGCLSALQAGFRFTQRRQTFSRESSRKSKPKSSKQPSWYFIWGQERMQSVIIWLICWVKRVRRSPRATVQRSYSIMMDQGWFGEVGSLLLVFLKMEQLVRWISLLSLDKVQVSWEKRQQPVWYRQITGLPLLDETRTHCLISNFLPANSGGFWRMQGLGMYLWMILFQYFFLFLNQLHMLSGLRQNSLDDLTREIPAPREEAMGLMIQRGVVVWLQDQSSQEKSLWQCRTRMRSRQSISVKERERYYILIPSRQKKDFWIRASQNFYLGVKLMCLYDQNVSKYDVYLSYLRISSRYMHSFTKIPVYSLPIWKMEDYRISQRCTSINSPKSSFKNPMISLAITFSIILAAMRLFSLANYSY